jgi:Flp pilus assembly protein TadG
MTSPVGADLDVNVAEVDLVSKDMIASAEKTQLALGTLRTTVTNLLNPDGGLYLRKTSPQMTQSYQDLTTSLDKAMVSIKSFSDTFQVVVTNLRTLDGEEVPTPPQHTT